VKDGEGKRAGDRRWRGIVKRGRRRRKVREVAEEGAVRIFIAETRRSGRRGNRKETLIRGAEPRVLTFRSRGAETGLCGEVKIGVAEKPGLRGHIRTIFRLLLPGKTGFLAGF
jgi:hypothetical protein